MNQTHELDIDAYPSIAALTRSLLAVWPEHEKHIKTRFRNDTEVFLDRCDMVAKLAITLIGGDHDRYCRDYQWMCQQFLEERVYFQRHGHYRLKHFEEAEREVYSNAEFMGRYMRGLLLSQIFWRNHALVLDIFRTSFLTSISESSEYLEVGPGHGLFFYFAAQTPVIRMLTGWDISDSSITATRHAMQNFAVDPSRFRLMQQDILASNSPAECFDSVVISEVLEHLETPDIALKSLYKTLRTGGRIFIHIPINSPAPDHIYLWRTPEEVLDFVQRCGFKIEENYNFPIAGYTLDQCRKHAVDISCVVIASKI